MKPNLRIRQANLEDCPAIAQVQVHSYHTVYAGLFPQTFLDRFTYEEQTQDWRNLLTGQTRDLLYVAEIEKEEIIGYALGRPGLTSIAPYDSELVALHVPFSWPSYLNLSTRNEARYSCSFWYWAVSWLS
jgi:hypothetical protein